MKLYLSLIKKLKGRLWLGKSHGERWPGVDRQKPGITFNILDYMYRYMENTSMYCKS